MKRSLKCNSCAAPEPCHGAVDESGHCDFYERCKLMPEPTKQFLAGVNRLLSESCVYEDDANAETEGARHG